ncbi:cyclophilin-like fold protein [Chryseobacterium polytrichastri]|uniref:Cyclophilin-like n=1 Tax=Chryseobacterium polytrichastri TaxID=1302687 RepID=A0A1M6VQ55_9FLAO|nr:cyclophilin-like fold protein [Chryseobacterium polytrichastri]SHK83630.1 Cyclophilin-like [Chryseobacterium polytrichastri]
MKYSFLIILTFVSALFCSAASCNKNDDNHSIKNSNTMTNGKIKITVNSKTFIATLLDNNSAKAFKEMLPLTINMAELNGNEKYYDLPTSLPVNSSNPGTIKNGDLMLYGSKTLVLFYKSFSTSYSYTKLGTVDDVTGLASDLGSGNVTVTFELE